MGFDTYFRASSYATVFAGVAALYVTGGIGHWLGIAFLVLMILSWRLEGTRWQLSERAGLVVVLLSLPLFYLDWHYQMGSAVDGERIGVTALSHLVLFLSAVKLVQSKQDRDWVFLYLIAFFELLLAAGLSISPAFVVALGVFLLCMLSTIVAFEIRKSRRVVKPAETRLLIAAESHRFRRISKRVALRHSLETRRLPWVTVILAVLIVAVGMPLFFVFPRYGSAAFLKSGYGISGLVGFSDSVRLGDIGRLQQTDRVVMRVRVEGAGSGLGQGLRWRGVALDQFRLNGWSRSNSPRPEIIENKDKNFFPLGTTEALHKLTTQTFFIEPLDTNVLFAAPRVVAVQAAMPYLRRDKEDALSSRAHESSRLTYKVFSDISSPDEVSLRRDMAPYSRDEKEYLELPAELDPAIYELASKIVKSANARNRYDAAVAIQKFLQDPQNFRYTLDLKATGPDPLSDFLFRVKEGHCEYFATALAVMLRTQGIATRIVNGFQTGIYNDAADVYTVTQRDAHSWVEVYFPESDKWVTFDPTPAAGRRIQSAAGLTAQLGKYAEALEMIWTEYFVGYDRQEQKSLAAEIRSQLTDFRFSFASWSHAVRSELKDLFSSDTQQGGVSARTKVIRAAAAFLGVVLLVWLLIRVRRLGWRRALTLWRSKDRGPLMIEFYGRMIRAYQKRGISREPSQTPLEFANMIGSPEALLITKAYNRVRYGEEALSVRESQLVEDWLRRLEYQE
jgi:protein-glutamine gamma-glutamyltransferase